MKIRKLIINTLPDTWISFWGNTVTNAIEKHVRKGEILHTSAQIVFGTVDVRRKRRLKTRGK